MALTKADIVVWEELSAKNAIPRGADLLEIGESNWYGEVAPHPDDAGADRFAIARNFYQRVLAPRCIVSIDLNGSARSLQLDLNQPIVLPDELPQMFGVIVNTGTAEHVFDQAQLFETIHDRCAVGGLMIHAAPVDGWTHHGFYTYQPTLFEHIARANAYETLVALVYRPTERDALLYVAWRLTAPALFVKPIQGR